MLAKLWDYAAYQAIARGVVTPKGEEKIILFVSEEKPGDFTQYKNRLQGNTLMWEGESGHSTDERIVNAERVGDEIHVFHRYRHRDLFTYFGLVKLVSFKHESDKPSQAVFSLTN